jgi:hypothetical protein
MQQVLLHSQCLQDTLTPTSRPLAPTLLLHTAALLLHATYITNIARNSSNILTACSPSVGSSCCCTASLG